MTDAFEQQSSQPGFRPQDFPIACSINPDRICPAKEHLVSLYVGNAGQEGVDAVISYRDRAALSLKLTEFAFRADPAAYDETTVGCPARTVMNESRTRQTAVHGIRGVLKYFRSTNQK
jgi:hypothetical protein